MVATQVLLKVEIGWAEVKANESHIRDFFSLVRRLSPMTFAACKRSLVGFRSFNNVETSKLLQSVIISLLRFLEVQNSTGPSFFTELFKMLAVQV
jgi:hypothetical protein